MKNEYLKETYSDGKITVSDVDIDAMHKHISSNDASIISEIIFDALVSMVEKMSVPPTPTLKLDAVTIPEALTVLNTELAYWVTEILVKIITLLY